MTLQEAGHTLGIILGRILRNTLRLVSGTIYLGLMVTLIAVLYLLLTQNGLQLLIKSTDYFAPGMVSIGRGEGRLFDRLVLTDVRISHPSVQFSAERIALDWRLLRLLTGQLSIRELTLTRTELILPASKTSPGEQDSNPFDFAALNQIRTQWPFSINLERFDASDTTLQFGAQRYTIERFQMGTQLADGRLLFHTDDLQAIGMVLDGDIQISGSRRHGLQLNGQVNWRYDYADSPLAGHLSVNGNLDQLSVTHSLTEPVRIDSDLTLQLANQIPTLTSVHRYSELCWPLTSPQVCMQKGELQFNARAASAPDFTSRLTTRLVTPTADGFAGLPTDHLDLMLEAAGNLDAALENLTAALDYHITASKASPLPPLSGAMSVQASTDAIALHTTIREPAEITINARATRHDALWKLAGDVGLASWNPATLIPSLPGELTADIAFSGELGAKSPVMTLHIRHLDGTLAEHPVTGNGVIRINKDQIHADNFSLAFFGSELTIQGAMDHSASGRFMLDLNVPNLALFSPELTGSAKVSGTVRGTLERPEFSFQALIAHLHTPAGHWPEVAAHLDGTLEEHQLRLTVAGESSANLVLNGKWAAPVWQGKLRELALQHPQAGAWTQIDTAELSVTFPMWSLESLCLAAGTNRVCLEGNGNAAEDVTGRIALEWNDFRPLAALLPNTLRIDVPLSARADVRYTPAGGAAGVVHVESRAGRVRWFSEGAGRLQMPAELTTLDLTFSPHEIAGVYHLNLFEYGSSQGSFTLSAPPNANYAYSGLQAQLKGAMTRFDWLEVFVPQVADVQGDLRWNLVLSGTPTAPQWQGDVTFKQGRFSLPDLGRPDLPLSLKAGFSGQRITLAARIDSGELGRLDLKGTIDVPTWQTWQASGRVTGTSFLASDTAEYVLRISPDLRFTALPGRFAVSGAMTVPEGQINYRGLPTGGIQISNDVIVISEEGPPPAAPFVLVADINLKTGEAVFFNGMGLNGRITGDVRYLRRENGLQEIFGDLGIREGEYRAFGYNLTIERGTAIFAGSPRNPGLEIVAERRLLSDERIPVLISGTLQEPVLTLPQASDDAQGDAFAKLLTGRSVGEGNGEGVVTDQVAMMSVGLAENVTQDLAQSLGFDSGGLRTDGDLESTSLYVGKQVTDRLFVGYGIGLITPEHTVNLRLKLNNNWSIEASSGRESGVDVIYNYETKTPLTLLRRPPGAADDGDGDGDDDGDDEGDAATGDGRGNDLGVLENEP